MKLTLVLASAAGLLIAVGLIAAFGFGSILEALRAVGWGAALVALVRCTETAGAGLAWRLLLSLPRPHLGPICMMLRWVRESINSLLPVAQVGGEVAGARLLSFFGVPGSTAGASVLVDLLIQTASQFLFTLVGLAFLVSFGGGEEMVGVVALGLAVMGPALAGFFAVQRYGGIQLVERIVARFAKNPHWAVLGGLQALNDQLLAIYAAPGRVAAAFALHLGIWFFGVLEIWTALHFMGHPVSYAQALVIESLGQAVRGAAFMVPGAIGVQEGGFVALCAVFGIPAPVAVALSLVKRIPEILLGIPGLFVWQGLESRNLLASTTVAKAPQTAEK